MAYLTSKEVRERLKGCSTATLWRYQQPKQKLFAKPMPPPAKKGAGSMSLWDEDTFNEWEEKYFKNNMKSLAM